MKKLLIPSLVVASLFAQTTNADLEKKINQLEQQLKTLKQQVKENQHLALENAKKVNPIAVNTHLFWSYDLRTSFDFIQKETTSGVSYTVNPNMGQFSPYILNNAMYPSNTPITNKSQFVMTMPVGGYLNSGTAQAQPYPKTVNADKYVGRIFTNRVILTGVYKPSDNLKATVRIEANKVFGFSNINSMQEPFQNVDWVANETPDDSNIRLKEAFFNYYFGPDNGLMFSAGRRPATNGFPANLREGDNPNSPLAHLINMEFDGFSFEISNDIFSMLSDKFSDWGTWIKFCAGRGYSNTNGKWSFTSNPDYTSDDTLKDSDFAGFILVPYDDGQYSLWTETVWAFNLRGFRPTGEQGMIDLDGNWSTINDQYILAGYSMPVVGNYFGENIVFKAAGIGDGISDFLDNTTAFISYAISKTHPKSGQAMLGSTDSKTGTSIWIGADMPGIGDNDRFGVNFVRGSKYWRSFTYGEDTLAGSIAAVRGKAIDIYYNHQIIPHLMTGIRYTYIKYDYPGSDAFFGDMGDPTNPFNMPYVKKAKDIRAYIRYNF